MESDRESGTRWKMAAVGAFIVVAILGSLLWFAKKDRRTVVPEVVAVKPPPPPPAPNLVSLSLSGDRQEIAANEMLNVTLKGQYSDGTQKNLNQGVEWHSSEPRVATIDEQGRVKARQTGETKITARYGDLVSLAWTLAVRAEQPAVAVTVPAEKPAVKTLVVTKLVALAISTDRREVQTQERLPLRVKARYSDGNEKGLSTGVEWRSSDSAVASVDSRGELLALRPGKITVVARWAGIESSAVNILVRESPVKPPPEPPPYKPAVESPQVTPAKPPVQTVNIMSYINRAKGYRVQGNYAAALVELEKARAISPASQEVFEEIEATRRACNAEQRLGREGLTC